MHILQAKSSYLSDLVYVQGRTQKGGGVRKLQPPSNQNFKNIDFVHMTILNVLHDLPFSRNQPLQSAVDKYIRILKNKIKNLGCLNGS
jgi:hypothetical protein